MAEREVHEICYHGYNLPGGRTVAIGLLDGPKGASVVMRFVRPKPEDYDADPVNYTEILESGAMQTMFALHLDTAVMLRELLDEAIDFFESFHVFSHQQVADFSSNTTNTKSLKQCRRGSHGYSAVFGGVA